MLSKQTNKIGDIELAPVYFNSTTTAVINSEYDLDKPLQEILYIIDNWINEGPAWIIESMVGECGNIFFTVYYQVHALNCLTN